MIQIPLEYVYWGLLVFYGLGFGMTCICLLACLLDKDCKRLALKDYIILPLAAIFWFVFIPVCILSACILSAWVEESEGRR